MLPASYINFFSVSTQVSAALIGLLFVSVSIETESVFGDKSALLRKLTALSAFTALVNTFFLSLNAILPMVSLGPAAIALGGLAVYGTAADALVVFRARQPGLTRARILLILISTALYVYEVVLGVRLTINPGDLGVVSDLITVVIAAYAIGLSRAWQLLGGRRGHSLIRQIREVLGGTASNDDDVTHDNET